MIKHKLSLSYLVKNISVVIGLVLIWRGIWYVLDGFDGWIFGGSPFIKLKRCLAINYGNF
ncbi:MAG: hypothetical protein Q8O93_00620 [bacterium]|nr:hypothetical protein [bacterium]